jgi:ClpX C4-type zinc finger
VPTDRTDLDAAREELRKAHRGVREVRYRHETGKDLPPDEAPLCSFCGAGQNNVQRMLASDSGSDPPAYICSNCVEAFHGANEHNAI